MQKDSSEAPRFQIREELVRDPRFVRLRAFDDRLQCEVTLEQPGAAVLARLDSASGDRALREARALARIQHPRVIRLREVVELNGLPTLVLDPTPGERLDVLLEREGRLQADVVIRIGRDLAQAAQAVHAEGIVHRGIAPENVVVDPRDGGAVLAGFTFAKPVDVKTGQSSLDHRGRLDGGAAMQGLPEYAAPEQVAGQPADHRADVFGLGCLLYRCATGRDAFPHDALQYEPPPPPRQVDKTIPKPLSELIARCIAHSPMARFPNMVAVDEALDALQQKSSKGPLLSPARLAALVTAVAAVVVAVVVFGRTGPPARAEQIVDFVSPSPDWRLDDPNLAVLAGRYSERRAVLVGINYVENPQFASQRLNNAERDVVAIQDRLRQLGWTVRENQDPLDRSGEVHTLTGDNASRVNILAELQWARGAGKDGQVFVYLAGHGQVDRNDPGFGWFVPSDGDVELDSKIIPFPSVTQRLLRSKGDAPKHVLIALDCCHSGAAIPTRGRRPYPRPEEERLLSSLEKEHLSRRARILLTSALDYQRARDGIPGEHSPFAAGFLAAFDKAVGGKRPLIASEIYVSVYEKVDAVAPEQCPWRTDVTQGDVEFVFLPPKE